MFTEIWNLKLCSQIRMNVALIHTTAARMASAPILKEVSPVDVILGTKEMELLAQVFLNTLCLCLWHDEFYSWSTFWTSSTLILDIDECTTDGHDCSDNGQCTNTMGSFSCSCNNGYTGNGKTCTGNCYKGPLSTYRGKMRQGFISLNWGKLHWTIPSQKQRKCSTNVSCKLLVWIFDVQISSSLILNTILLSIGSKLIFFQILTNAFLIWTTVTWMLSAQIPLEVFHAAVMLGMKVAESHAEVWITCWANPNTSDFHNSASNFNQNQRFIVFSMLHTSTRNSSWFKVSFLQKNLGILSMRSEIYHLPDLSHTRWEPNIEKHRLTIMLSTILNISWNENNHP